MRAEQFTCSLKHDDAQARERHERRGARALEQERTRRSLLWRRWKKHRFSVPRANAQRRRGYRARGRRSVALCGNGQWAMAKGFLPAPTSHQLCARDRSPHTAGVASIPRRSADARTALECRA